jgi:hypothetical protein
MLLAFVFSGLEMLYKFSHLRPELNLRDFPGTFCRRKPVLTIQKRGIKFCSRSSHIWRFNEFPSSAKWGGKKDHQF